MKLKSALIIFFLAACYLLPATVLAQGGLFEGGSRGGGIFEGGAPGLFSGVSDFFQGIFGGKEVPSIGGARIPIQPIGVIPTPPPGGPPSPDAGDYLKLSLTWDALSIGPEDGKPLEKDPLEEEHKDLIGCCGSNQDPYQGGCVRTEPKHVLWSWCGQDPKYTGDIPKPPDLPWCEDVADPDNTRCIPKQTPGPNDKTYDMAISNKYIRRDGYLFQCLSPPICALVTPPAEPTLVPQLNCTGQSCQTASDCSGANQICQQGQCCELPSTQPTPTPPPGTGPTPTPAGGQPVPTEQPILAEWNYVEFQTEIFHSNDFSLFLHVENQSSHPVENIQITYHPLTYSAVDLLYSLPHSVEFPVKYLGDGYVQQQDEDGRTPVFPEVQYEHASQLTPFEKTITLDGQPFDWKNLPPFEIGPFNLTANEKKVFPLQPTEIPARNEIPLSNDTPGQCYDPNQGSTSNLSQTVTSLSGNCLDTCDMVRLHDIDGLQCGDALCDNPDVCPKGCPTIKQCGIYYGLSGGGRDPHPEGSKCDQNCQQVSGCPPSYCFENSRCSPPSTPRSNLPECSEVYDGVNNDNQRYRTCPSATSSNPLTKLFIPKEAEAIGCYGYPPICPPKPPKPAGCGVMTPRDFNFICDPDDTNEESRCSGDGNAGVMPKVPDSQNRHLEFRDVTAMGGCGYEASSNNSVIGPIMFEAQYGKTQASRSVLLASVPIGGPILDDEARPFGWPASGKILEDWGATQTAQELGPFNRFIPGMQNEVGDDYLMCANDAKTYPPRTDGSTDPIGDYLHTGIDIAPNYEEETDVNVYSTQAGWVTFAGVDPKSPKSGWSVQVETDVTQDGLVDYVTRYDHLLANSIQIDTQYARLPFQIDGTKKPLGSGVYIPRNAILGKVGDSGSPGQTQLHYEIIDQMNWTDPQAPINKSGDISQSLCTADPYTKACMLPPAEGFYFAKDKFYTPDGNPVKGPIYKNP